MKGDNLRRAAFACASLSGIHQMLPGSRCRGDTCRSSSRQVAISRFLPATKGCIRSKADGGDRQKSAKGGLSGYVAFCAIAVISRFMFESIAVWPTLSTSEGDYDLSKLRPLELLGEGIPGIAKVKAVSNQRVDFFSFDEGIHLLEQLP